MQKGRCSPHWHGCTEIELERYLSRRLGAVASLAEKIRKNVGKGDVKARNRSQGMTKVRKGLEGFAQDHNGPTKTKRPIEFDVQE